MARVGVMSTDTMQPSFFGAITPAAPKVGAVKPTAVRIKELPLEEQPRERQARYGPGVLATAELLAVALEAQEIESIQRLLADSGGLGDLQRMGLVQLQELGLTRNAALRLQAVFELGRRMFVAGRKELALCKSPADAANLVMLDMAGLEQEHLRVIILDTKNKVMKVHTVYVGSVNTAVIRVAEVFREAVRLNATAVIVVHNHPSGDPTPSPEDVSITRQMVEAGKLLSIDVLDHLVIGDQRWVSLKERGLGF